MVTINGEAIIKMNRHIVSLMLLPALFNGSASAAVVSTDIVVDGSFANVTAQQLKPDGSTVVIDGIANGKINGNNLFFSFKGFSLATGDTAVFQCSGCTPVPANVISRVTGNDASYINGTINSKVGNADFWFINPHGIVIGNAGEINVPAALHLGAADSVLFSNGASYAASKPGELTGGLLEIASPQSFGYVAAPGYSGNLEIRGALNSASHGAIEIVAGNDVVNYSGLTSNVEASNNVVNYGSLTGSIKAGRNVENQSQGEIIANMNGSIEADNNVVNYGSLTGSVKAGHNVENQKVENQKQGEIMDNMNGNVDAGNNVVNYGSIAGTVKAGNDVENQTAARINGRVEAGNDIHNSGTLIFSNADGGSFLSAGNDIDNTGTLQINEGVNGTVQIVTGNSLKFNDGVLIRKSADLDITAPIVYINGSDSNSRNYYAISDGDNGAAPGRLLFNSGQKIATAGSAGINGVDGEFHLANAKIYSNASVETNQYYTDFKNSGIKSGQSISINTTNYKGFIPTVDTQLGSAERSAVFLDSPDTRVNNVSTNGANQSVLPAGVPLPFVLPNGNLRLEEDPCSNRKESSNFNKKINKFGNYAPEIGAQTFSSALSSIIGEDKTLLPGNAVADYPEEGANEAAMAEVEDRVKSGC